MDAAQALADLTEISSQIEAALLAETSGTVVASTFGDQGKGDEVARAGLELLREAETTRGDGREARLTQVQAATVEGSVFVVRDDRHLVVAVARRDPTVGLVFYDLKTCLRLVGQESPPEEKPRATRTGGKKAATTRKRSTAKGASKGAKDADA